MPEFPHSPRPLRTGAAPGGADRRSRREALREDSPDAPAASSPAPPPKPVRLDRTRALLFIAGAIIVSGGLLAVVFSLDRGAALPPAKPPLENVTELIPPTPLSPDELARASTDIHREMMVNAPQGGWIQLMDVENQRLAQQYRCARLEPNPPGKPPGWMQMQKPEIQLHQNDGRIVTLRSDSALIHAPSRMLESGTMSGNVLVRMYRPSQGAAVDLESDSPALEVRTSESTFDNILGEIRCDSEVDIQTSTAHLPGRGLRLQINDVADRVERLEIQHIDEGGIRLAAVSPHARHNSEPPTDPQQKQQKSSRSEKPKRDAKSKPSKQEVNAPTPLPDFYRVTFRGNVNIFQGDDQSGWTAGGDELGIVFSMKGRGLVESLAQSNEVQLHSQSGPLGITKIIPSLAIASLQHSEPGGLYQSTEDEIRVTCDGGLLMIPLGSDEQRPASPDDAHFELRGSPVHIRDFAEKADIRCALLTYQTQSQRLELSGDQSHPFLIESPALQATAGRFWLIESDARGALEGMGAMSVGHKTDSDGNVAAADSQLHLTWTDHVDLHFAPKQHDETQQQRAFGKIESAHFHGEVTVQNDEFSMNSNELLAKFAKPVASESETDARGSIEQVVATGSVLARNSADQGSIATDTLTMEFARTQAGKTLPIALVADGHVAVDEPGRQTVWCDSLDVEFKTDAEMDAANDQSSRVKTFTASTNVQVLMADGARAFGDVLVANANDQVATLTGEDVRVYSDNAVISRGTRLDLTQSDGKATWIGPGEFAQYANPIPAGNQPHAIAVPLVDEQANPRTLVANWTSGLVYDSQANHGEGSLHITGDIQVKSTPTALELNTMTGDALTLDFGAEAVRDASNSAPAAPDNASSPTIPHDSRRLHRFTARGNAKLESRTWLNADHGDKPRVYYVSGPEVMYDAISLEARVRGTGEMLVRDERPDNPESSQMSAGNQTPVTSTFDSKGATVFRWAQHLEMTRRPDSENVFDIDMLGDVRITHQALDQAITKIRCDQLLVTVKRTQAREQRNQALDLGGSMDLQSLRGNGGVYVDAPTRDVECDEFVYDYQTGIATLTAAPGRVVTVTTAGSAHPLRAQRVIWDMKQDKLTAEHVSGAAPR